MKEDKNDILLSEFFAQARSMQISDDGFSDNVMQNIERLENKKLLRLSHLWTIVCCMLGIIFIVFSATSANIQWHEAENILGIAVSYVFHILKHIEDFNFSLVLRFIFPVPLALSILFAIAAIKHESKQAVI